MTKTGSAGRGRWAVRACAAGAAVAAAAGTGGAATAATAATVTIPVPCSASTLMHDMLAPPANAILVLKRGCTYRIPGRLPQVNSNLTIVGSGDTLAPADGNDFTAMGVADSQLVISHLTFRGFFTDSDTDPGALYNLDGTVTITASQFIDNTGGSYGGAILNEGGGILNVSDTAFLGNVSGYDDCQAARSADCGCHAVRPADCGVDGFGGAIYNDFTSVATLTHDNFLGNTSTDEGGAIYLNGGTVTVRGQGASPILATDFTDNTADGDDGGAIDNSDGSLIVSYAAFSHNSSDEYGGAIDNGGVTPLDVSGSSFADNDSEYGGAIETHDGPLNLTGDLFTGNSADQGGALAVSNNTTTLNQTMVTGNHASDEGGGIYRYRVSTVTLTNGSLVTGNTPDNCYGFSC
jgi:predicted outer membrane repeat protein